MNKETGRKRKKRTGLAPLQKFITVLLAALAVSFATMVFFKVDTFVVIGNSQYTDEEIIEASSVSLGDNLILINKGKTANLIRGQLNYITEVKLLRVLPGTLEISVNESGAAAYVTDTVGSCWYIDKTGKVLSKADQPSGIQVTGFTPEGATAGYQLSAAAEDKTRLTQLTTLLEALERVGIASNVSVIDLTTDYNPKLTYDERFVVELGSTDDIDYKLEYLIAVRQLLTDSQSGTIDLTLDSDSMAHFRPNAASDTTYGEN